MRSMLSSARSACLMSPTFRHSRMGAVWRPSLSLVTMGSFEIDSGGTGCIHQYRRQRRPVVPAIAAQTKHLTIFQRTPIWVAPRFDDPFTSEQQELFASDPAEALKLRDAAVQQERGRPISISNPT